MECPKWLGSLQCRHTPSAAFRRTRHTCNMTGNQCNKRGRWGRTGCFVCFLRELIPLPFHGNRTGNFLWLFESFSALAVQTSSALYILHILSAECGSWDSTHTLPHQGCNVDYLFAQEEGRRKGPKSRPGHLGLPAVSRSLRGWVALGTTAQEIWV